MHHVLPLEGPVHGDDQLGTRNLVAVEVEGPLTGALRMQPRPWAVDRISVVEPDDPVRNASVRDQLCGFHPAVDRDDDLIGDRAQQRKRRRHLRRRVGGHAADTEVHQRDSATPADPFGLSRLVPSAVTSEARRSGGPCSRRPGATDSNLRKAALLSEQLLISTYVSKIEHESHRSKLAGPELKTHVAILGHQWLVGTPTVTPSYR